MSKSKRRNKRTRMNVREIVEAAMSDIGHLDEPSLAVPIEAMHSVLLFAIEKIDDFTVWVNEGATTEEDKLSKEDIGSRLEMLHKSVDRAYGQTIQPEMRVIQAPRELIEELYKNHGMVPPDVPGNYL